MFDFLCVILKLMTPPLCNSATRRADQQFCTTSAAEKDCSRLTLCACLCMFTKKHMNAPFDPGLTVMSARVVQPRSGPVLRR